MFRDDAFELGGLHVLHALIIARVGVVPTSSRARAIAPGRLVRDASLRRARKEHQMYGHSCAKAGAVGCNWKLRADTEEELKAKVVAYAKSKQGVNMTDTATPTCARRPGR